MNLISSIRKAFAFFLKRGLSLADEKNADKPIFVSLGSICIPAGYISESGLRSSGYMPFDWICSKDGEKLLEIIKDDFLRFFEKEHFVPYSENPRQDDNFLHNYYHLEFVHDQDAIGDWASKFIPKYKRRIERFRQLAQAKGKVTFIRYASGFDPDCYWYFPENSDISDAYSLRLYNALRDRFPNLDFNLLIMNRGYGQVVEKERLISNRIWSVRFNPSVSRYNPGSQQPMVRAAFRDLLLKISQKP